MFTAGGVMGVGVGEGVVGVTGGVVTMGVVGVTEGATTLGVVVGERAGQKMLAIQGKSRREGAHTGCCGDCGHGDWVKDSEESLSPRLCR